MPSEDHRQMVGVFRDSYLFFLVFMDKMAHYHSTALGKASRYMAYDEFFIEQREGGDYAIRRPGSERASGVEQTQREAIERARQMDPNATIHVQRVRNTNVGGRDKWRNP